MQLDIIRFEELCSQYRLQWNALLPRPPEGIHQLDVTSSFEWADTLRRVRLERYRCEIATLTDQEHLCGVFPFYRSSERVRWMPIRRLIAISEAYSGRNGFIADDPSRFAHELLSYLIRTRGWDQVILTITHDSRSMHALESTLRALSLNHEVVHTHESPYIEFPEDWETYLSALPKKFRWLVRNAQKKMEAAGTLENRHFAEPAVVEEFLRLVIEIEQGSWKERSGTSITQNTYQQDFYTQFAHAAAHNGWLSGHVLLLDEKPVAYIFGVVFGGVFHDLKESYQAQFQELSPGHVLKAQVFPLLIEQRIRWYDFRGRCDDYKMKWARHSYGRSTFAIYNRTARAHCLRALGSLRNRAFRAFRRTSA